MNRDSYVDIGQSTFGLSVDAQIVLGLIINANGRVQSVVGDPKKCFEADGINGLIATITRTN